MKHKSATELALEFHGPCPKTSAAAQAEIVRRWPDVEGYAEALQAEAVRGREQIGG